MGIVSVFNLTNNFWEENPQLAVAGVFKQLYNDDKSKKKEDSSKLMWCVSLIWDMDSKFYNLEEYGEDGKIYLIFEDYFNDKYFYDKNTDTVEGLKNFYLKLQETPARRSLYEIERKIEERTQFLAETKYTLGEVGDKGNWVGGTAAIIDGMLSNSKKIYDLYEQAKKMVDAEKNKDDDRVKGGGKVSLTDAGRI